MNTRIVITTKFIKNLHRTVELRLGPNQSEREKTDKLEVSSSGGGDFKRKILKSHRNGSLSGHSR